MIWGPRRLWLWFCIGVLAWSAIRLLPQFSLVLLWNIFLNFFFICCKACTAKLRLSKFLPLYMCSNIIYPCVKKRFLKCFNVD
jgi:hypothetical protein